MSMLRAGSNFKNENSTDNLIGTNGVGASIVNMLSECFSITTGDGIKAYKQTWCNFESNGIWIKKNTHKGTVVDYIPRSDIFENSEWDKDILYTSFLFRNYLKNSNPILKNLDFIFEFDNVKMDLNKSFIPDDAIIVDGSLGRVILTKSFPSSTNLSFINGQMCSGIHQKVVQDYINDICKDDKAHDFYDTFISLNFEPKYVTFGDQNKTRFVTKRTVIEPFIEKNFKSKIKKSFTNSELYKYVQEEIEKRKLGTASKKINTLSKKKSILVSNKYFPATKKKDMILYHSGLKMVR
jgi:DNA gyrase/topoisomerase IV subunit B